MSKELLLLVDVLAKEKNLDKELVFQGLEKALALATKKSHQDDNPDIEVTIDRLSGKYKTVRKWKVVSDVDFYDDDCELSLSDAAAKYADIELDDVIEEEIPNIELGRVSAQTARNVITQHIKDAEKEAMLHEYLSRNKGIVVGRVRRFDRGNVVVESGKIEAVILRGGLIPKEVLPIGSQVKGYLDKSSIQVKHSRVVISRSCNEFLAKLLENNVPEIATNRVEIKAIAREPGIRAKVAVFSHDSRVDAKGACIGFRNQRIDAVGSELSGEKIDIIDYDSDIAQFAINALAPAQINNLVVDEVKQQIDVVVDDDKLGLAIGPDGVNVRLASKLVGMTVNLYGNTEANSHFADVRKNLIESFGRDLDVDSDIATVLVDNGFNTLEEVAYVDEADMLAIEEFDDDLAKELQTRARNKILAKNITNKEAMDQLVQELQPVAKLPRDFVLKLVEAKVFTLGDLADLAQDELVTIIEVDENTANNMIMKARELSGYFD